MMGEDRDQLCHLFREFMASFDDLESRIEELERMVQYLDDKGKTGSGVDEDQVESMISEALDSLTFHTYID
tara:strand:+ start:607 stop:819 length:213 start_codon:yes stop_codon:yes gene_type:complete